ARADGRLLRLAERGADSGPRTQGDTTDRRGLRGAHGAAPAERRQRLISCDDVAVRMHPARALWQCIEPYHAVTYFTDEARDAFEAAGRRGFWRGYFAGRAAPLGEVGTGVVVATFYGFHPDFVARAVPGVWSIVSPSEAIAAREAGAEAALARRLDVPASDL